MGTQELSAAIAARKAELAFYSPYHFLPQLSSELQQHLFGAGKAGRWAEFPEAELLDASIADKPLYWLLRHLAWDSAYFGAPTYQLFTGLFDGLVTPAELVAAAVDLPQQLAMRHERFYAFGIIPTEDTRLLQGLTSAGWRLVETRLTYYRDHLDSFDYPRYLVRQAEPAEAPLIGAIAAAARNPYDRVHADPWFGQARADAYLARYAENALAENLAAAMLVPAEEHLPVDSFLAISDLPADAAALNTQLSRVLLTAVGPANRGWHVKLVAETVHRARQAGHEAVLMTTQSTNYAVARTCEKLGFKLGAVSHVLACSKG